MMTRRGFLGVLATGLVGACVVTKIPTAWIPEPVVRYAGLEPAAYGTVGAINRSTYSFWRNQATLGESRPIDEQVFRDVFDRCEKIDPKTRYFVAYDPDDPASARLHVWDPSDVRRM